MNQSQGKTGRQGYPPLLIDERAGVGGNGGRVEQGGGQRTVDLEFLQRLALQGRKVRGISLLSLTQVMR